jgi:uncharacterized protein
MASRSPAMEVAVPEGLIVIGEGRVCAVPDEVVLIIAVESSGVTAVQALTDTATKIVQVVRVMIDRGISQSDMHTTWVNAYPIYAQGEPGSVAGAMNQAAKQHAAYGAFPQAGAPIPSGPMPQILGFVASRGLQITLRGSNRMGEMIDTALAAGASHSSGFALRLRDDVPLRRAALEAAAKDACARAELLATTMGRQLGALRGLVEEPWLQAAQAIGDGLGSLTGGVPAGYQNLATQPVLPGEITFVARVRITFDLTR